MVEITDEMYRDIADHQKSVVMAARDVSDIARDARGWPEADEIMARATEAEEALDALNDAIDAYLPES